MKYAKTEFKVNVPEEQIMQELESNEIAFPARNVKEIVEDALDHPVGAGMLDTVLSPGDTVAVIVSDVTRRWQSPETYLPVLIERINSCGVPDDHIRIISATGTHRRQTPEEHAGILGPELSKRFTIIDHICDDKEHLRFMGTSRRGTPVWLNSYAMECDKLILTGGVVYHFLAGFGGGRKSVVPGIAGRETINTNHCNALNPGFGSGSNPNACSGNLSGTNPFHDDLEECAAFAKPAYLLNVVADANQRIVAAYAGDWIKAHRKATELVESMDGVKAEKRCQLVIASAGGYPKDINLYQTSKTLANSLLMTEPGGTMIILSQCSEGFGDSDCEQQLTGFKNMDEREKALRADFSIGGYVGFDFAEASEKYNLIMVTDILKEKFSKTHIKCASTLDEALEIAKQCNGGSIEGMTIALLPHGAQTKPCFE
jgi:nickel-dependent lactate racemase